MSSRIQALLEGLGYTFKEEGLFYVSSKTCRLLRDSLRSMRLPFRPKETVDNSLFDVMFINGCDYGVPHPIRYRVDHQIEQLLAAGLSASRVDAWNLNDDILRHSRSFIIFRCPLTEEVGSFIKKAKRLNKRVIYDIDDLVIDTDYTNMIPYVASMSDADKAIYDDGVRRMGDTLKLCDCAITTTAVLAEELSKFVPRVYINRNTASEKMLEYSDRALYRRDLLPSLPETSIKLRDRKIYKLAKRRGSTKKTNNSVVIGYFSGSITHNSDFELVLPVLIELMDKYDNLEILISGELDVSHELNRFGARVRSVPFCEWRRLPELISRCDINIAPLVDTLFNRAKSENKWIEASLVRVPTVASRVGAFEEMIEDGITGFLCNDLDEWRSKLTLLIESQNLRNTLADNSYRYCRERCTTIGSAKRLADIIRGEQSTNVLMVMPSLNTSGGVLVALRHCSMLQDAGYDVTLANSSDSQEWIQMYGHSFPVLNRVVCSGMMDGCPFTASIDIGVATLWDTLDFLKRYPKVSKIKYLVQNLESDFYLPGNFLRLQANSTYLEPFGIDYLTISPWCRDWLGERYGQDCRLVPNGLDVSQFSPTPRSFNSGKIRILIEGDCGSEYKNVDEAFRVVDLLDSSQYEIWYMSYTGTAKPFYRIDNRLGAVPHDKIADVYRQCHILLKTSILESFSYPPLEMMATGGFVVAVPNGGNAEFLVNEKNCLLYQQGDLRAAKRAIERIVRDEDLRSRLFESGIETASSRDWHNLSNDIVKLYS